MNQEDLRKEGTWRYVIGLDEVGFGSAACDLGVGCVVLPIDSDLKVKDSKAYSSIKLREEAYLRVKAEMLWGRVELVPSDAINHLGLGRAKDKAVIELLIAVTKEYSPKDTIIIIDGSYIPKRLPDYLKEYTIRAVPKGDTKITSCSAASVLAKIEHDRLVSWYAQDPELAKYDIANNQGYLTPSHIKALKDYGPAWIHRLDNKAVKAAIEYRKNLIPNEP